MSQEVLPSIVTPCLSLRPKNHLCLDLLKERFSSMQAGSRACWDECEEGRTRAFCEMPSCLFRGESYIMNTGRWSHACAPVCFEIPTSTKCCVLKQDTLSTLLRGPHGRLLLVLLKCLLSTDKVDYYYWTVKDLRTTRTYLKDLVWLDIYGSVYLILSHTHTHTHTQRERERERDFSLFWTYFWLTQCLLSLTVC